MDNVKYNVIGYNEGIDTFLSATIGQPTYISPSGIKKDMRCVLVLGRKFKSMFDKRNIKLVDEWYTTYNWDGNEIRFYYLSAPSKLTSFSSSDKKKRDTRDTLNRFCVDNRGEVQETLPFTLVHDDNVRDICLELLNHNYYYSDTETYNESQAKFGGKVINPYGKDFKARLLGISAPNTRRFIFKVPKEFDYGKTYDLEGVSLLANEEEDDISLENFNKYVIPLLQHMFSDNCTVVMHNWKYDAKVYRWFLGADWFLDNRPTIRCTMTVAHLFDPNRSMKELSLKNQINELYQYFLNYDRILEHEYGADRWFNAPYLKLANYLSFDLAATELLDLHQRIQLDTNIRLDGLTHHYENYQEKALWTTFITENNGLPIDLERCAYYIKLLDGIHKQLIDNIKSSKVFEDYVQQVYDKTYGIYYSKLLMWREKRELSEAKAKKEVLNKIAKYESEGKTNHQNYKNWLAKYEAESWAREPSKYEKEYTKRLLNLGKDVKNTIQVEVDSTIKGVLGVLFNAYYKVPKDCLSDNYFSCGLNENTLGRVHKAAKLFEGDFNDDELNQALFELNKFNVDISKQELVQFMQYCEDNYSSSVIVYYMAARKINKILNTYLRNFLKAKDSVDGRLHANLNNTVTSTGRLSGTNPNMTNLPLYQKIVNPLIKMSSKCVKAVIRPQKGHIISETDFSAVELRFGAFLANDATMIHYFKNNIDLHAESAKKIGGYTDEQWDALDKDTKKKLRTDIGKVSNFSIIFKTTANGLVYQADVKFNVKMTKPEAENNIKQWNELYSGIPDWQDQVVTFSLYQQEAMTLFNFIRPFDINKIKQKIYKDKGLDIDEKTMDYYLRRYIEKRAVNTPIQGGAGKYLVYCSYMINDYLAKNKDAKFKVISKVHDSIWIEHMTDDPAIILENLKIVHDIMQKQGLRLLKEEFFVDIESVLPIDVESEVGYDASIIYEVKEMTVDGVAKALQKSKQQDLDTEIWFNLENLNKELLALATTEKFFN